MNKYMICSVALVGTLTFASCGNGAQNAGTAAASEEQVAVVVTMDVDSLLASGDSLAGKMITVEGICTHICSKGGGKLFLMGSDDTKTIRVEAGPKIGKFTQEVVNNILTINGTLQEQRIDEAYLAQWEAQVKAQTEEKHGENGAGCDSEQKAHGEKTGVVSGLDRIAAFRQRIADRKATEGKEYLSFYYIDGDSFTINK